MNQMLIPLIVLALMFAISARIYRSGNWLPSAVTTLPWKVFTGMMVTILALFGGIYSMDRFDGADFIRRHILVFVVGFFIISLVLLGVLVAMSKQLCTKVGVVVMTAIPSCLLIYARIEEGTFPEDGIFGAGIMLILTTALSVFSIVMNERQKVGKEIK